MQSINTALSSSSSSFWLWVKGLDLLISLKNVFRLVEVTDISWRSSVSMSIPLFTAENCKLDKFWNGTLSAKHFTQMTDCLSLTILLYVFRSVLLHLIWTLEQQDMHFIFLWFFAIFLLQTPHGEIKSTLGMTVLTGWKLVHICGSSSFSKS